MQQKIRDIDVDTSVGHTVHAARLGKGESSLLGLPGERRQLGTTTTHDKIEITAAFVGKDCPPEQLNSRNPMF